MKPIRQTPTEFDRAVLAARGYVREAILCERHDYHNGDPSLDILERRDGRFDLTIFRGVCDLTVHELSADDIRTAAERMLAFLDLRKS